MTTLTKPSFRVAILAALASLAIFSVTYVIYTNINLIQPILKNYHEKNTWEENESLTSLSGKSMLAGGDGDPTVNVDVDVDDEVDDDDAHIHDDDVDDALIVIVDDDDVDVDGLPDKNNGITESLGKINGDASNNDVFSDSLVDVNIVGNTDAEQSNDVLDQETEIESSNFIGIDNATMMEIREYRTKRVENFDAWFKDSKLLPNIDVDGPILDFAISGFAKCGTTSMEANLGYIAPMPIADVCGTIKNTVYFAYKNWPKEFDNVTNPTKILRGTKCPRGIAGLKGFSTYLPKTLIIVGIRHPVMFFQSFWNMMMDHRNMQNRNKTPYDFMNPCGENDRSCNNECPGGVLLCLHRSRFHLPLARAGKTSLSDQERELLAPDDKDGGSKLTNHHIKNPIFLYELGEINEDYMWDKLAELLKVPPIPHDRHEGNNKKRQKSPQRINICDAYYDDFRSIIMPHAYNMSAWFCDYLVPAAKNASQNIHMANPDRFCELVKSYVDDPCERLIRLDNGTYSLKDGVDLSEDKR